MHFRFDLEQKRITLGLIFNEQIMLTYWMLLFLSAMLVSQWSLVQEKRSDDAWVERDDGAAISTARVGYLLQNVSDEKQEQYHQAVAVVK